MTNYSPEFREHLDSTKDMTLVEAISNTFWVSGLPPSKTLSACISVAWLQPAGTTANGITIQINPLNSVSSNQRC